ncbi:hypothetical protein [Leucobacter sp. GX0328]
MNTRTGHPSESEQMPTTVARAMAIARAAHASQRDKQHRDYFDAHLTPIAHGAEALATAIDAANAPHLVAAAWLHDVVEDTPYTPDALTAQGIHPSVVSAVDSVTRRNGEPYPDLITRSCAHPLGRLVKLVDNSWNLVSNPDLAVIDPERARALREERYLPARARLLAAADLTERSPAMLRVRDALVGERERLAR